MSLFCTFQIFFCNVTKNIPITATLQAICKEYHKRICQLEDDKFDLEYEVGQKDFMVRD